MLEGALFGGMREDKRHVQLTCQSARDLHPRAIETPLVAGIVRVELRQNNEIASNGRGSIMASSTSSARRWCAIGWRRARTTTSTVPSFLYLAIFQAIVDRAKWAWWRDAESAVAAREMSESLSAWCCAGRGTAPAGSPIGARRCATDGQRIADVFTLRAACGHQHCRVGNGKGGSVRNPARRGVMPGGTVQAVPACPAPLQRHPHRRP
jgi:hypothetical protein